MINVACVLRSGGRYDATWVHRLRDGVARHLTLPHRFICLTDTPVDCLSVPLSTDWPGWWAKLEVFRLAGKVLYLDLDSVVVGSLDDICAAPHKFTMVHEYYRPHFACSTAMAWDGDYSYIAREFARVDSKETRDYYDNWTPCDRIGDQAFIEDCLKRAGRKIEFFRDRFGERSIASYKVHCKDKGLDGTEAVVAFHGSLKPDNLNHVDWVRRAWHGT
jgi:hypothetical protein